MTLDWKGIGTFKYYKYVGCHCSPKAASCFGCGYNFTLETHHRFLRVWFFLLDGDKINFCLWRTLKGGYNQIAERVSTWTEQRWVWPLLKKDNKGKENVSNPTKILGSMKTARSCTWFLAAVTPGFISPHGQPPRHRPLQEQEFLVQAGALHHPVLFQGLQWLIYSWITGSLSDSMNKWVWLWLISYLRDESMFIKLLFFFFFYRIRVQKNSP